MGGHIRIRILIRTHMGRMGRFLIRDMDMGMVIHIRIRIRIHTRMGVESLIRCVFVFFGCFFLYLLLFFVRLLSSEFFLPCPPFLF